MTLDDNLPPRRPARSATALWWTLIGIAAVAAALLFWPREAARTSPAERNTTTVTRAPVVLPATR